MAKRTDGNHAFDPKCHELAEYFLSTGHEDQVSELAQAIQHTVDLWLFDELEGSNAPKD